MSIGKFSCGAALVAAVSMTATPVLASYQETSSRTMRDIIGRDSDDATRMIKDRGYSYVEGTHDQYSNKHTYWWNDRQDNCLHVTSYRGNVVDAADAKDKDCNQGGGGDRAAVVGAIAGVALLGALLHKKHHKKGKEYDEQGTLEFERGFRDGLHNAQYHNYSRTEAYTEGYQAGVEQRRVNLSHHTGGAGYQQDARYSDLIGARASAIDQLSNRGFNQVDNFVSGTARYSVWYRSQSRQCIQVITSDGRLENITDIRTHPNCR